MLYRHCFSSVLECTIRKVNKDGLKLNDTHQLLDYADDVIILGGSVHTIKKNAEALLVGSKEIGLGVNANNTNCIVMSRDQNAGQNHNIKTDNKSLEMVEQFKYLGTTVTNQNSIQEEIKSRVKLGNTCYHSVQYLASSSLLSRNIRINHTEL